MVSVRKRRKQKSGKGSVRPSKRSLKRERARKVALPQGDIRIAEAWNPKLTLAQNYRALGLVADAKKVELGAGELVPRKIQRRSQGAEIISSLSSLAASEAAQRLRKDQALIERDSAGNVINIVYGEREADEEDDDDGKREAVDSEDWQGMEDGPEPTKLVKELEAHAALLRSTSQPSRDLSWAEKEWAAKLVEKHGSDFEAMRRDAKLNKLQNTVGEIRRRVAHYLGQTASKGGR